MSSYVFESVCVVLAAAWMVLAVVAFVNSMPGYGVVGVLNTVTFSLSAYLEHRIRGTRRRVKGTIR